METNKWVFPKIVFFSPQIMNFNRVFHEINHPFWGTPIFGNTQIFPNLRVSKNFPTSPATPGIPFHPQMRRTPSSVAWGCGVCSRVHGGWNGEPLPLLVTNGWVKMLQASFQQELVKFCVKNCQSVLKKNSVSSFIIYIFCGFCLCSLLLPSLFGTHQSTTPSNRCV